MSSSEDEPLNLTSLPSDVVRKIIHDGREDIDVMRLISPRWNALVDEFFSNRKNLPVINSFCWDKCGYSGFLSLRISKRFRKYFGLENWHSSDPLRNNDSNFVELKPNNKLLFDEDQKWKNLARIFNRCSFIEKIDLTIGYSIRIDEFTALVNAINGVVVERLCLSTNPDLATIKPVIHLIGNINLGSIVFDYSYKCLSKGFDELFPEVVNILRLVPKIEVISTRLSLDSTVGYYVIPLPMRASIANDVRDNFKKFAEKLEMSPVVPVTMHDDGSESKILIVKRP